MRAIICMLYVGIGISANTQLLQPIQFDTNVVKYEFILQGGADYFSSSIYRDFGSKLLFGGRISDDIKNKTFDRHTTLNRFGVELQGEMEFRNYAVDLFGNKNWGYVIKAGYATIGSAAYSKDLFGLAFYGNDSYLDTTADFSGTTAKFMSFQKIGFGVISKSRKSSIVFNVINVSTALKGVVNTGELRQNADGSFVALTLDGTFASTRTSNFSNGIGAALDFDFKVPFNWIKDRKAYLHFQLKNLGIAYMYQGMQQYVVDSTYNYAGFSVDQLVNNESLFGDQFSVTDSLQIESKIVNKWVVLPTLFQAGKIIDEHYTGKLQSFFGVRLYPTMLYSPLVYAGANYRPFSWLDLGVSGSFGGFGGFRTGFYSSFKVKLFHVGIGTEDVIGWISKRGLGQSLNLRLRCKF